MGAQPHTRKLVLESFTNVMICKNFIEMIKVQICLAHENAFKLAYSNVPIKKIGGETGPHHKGGSVPPRHRGGK